MTEFRKISGGGRARGIASGILQTCLVLLLAAEIRAQNDTAEYRMKAAYLKTIPSFVEWPDIGKEELAARTVHLCVIGNYPFGSSLGEEAARSTASGKKMDVRWTENSDDLGNCRLIFISRSEARRYALILRAVKRSSALTVGETPDFLESGGNGSAEFSEKCSASGNQSSGNSCSATEAGRQASGLGRSRHSRK